MSFAHGLQLRKERIKSQERTCSQCSAGTQGQTMVIDVLSSFASEWIWSCEQLSASGLPFRAEKAIADLRAVGSIRIRPWSLAPPSVARN
jgi:hypothetical protein